MDKQEETLLELFQKANEYIPVFQALADSERLLILLKLFYAGEKGKNVTELSGKTRLSRPAISHHLKVLKAAKVIDSRKEGTQIYYVFQAKEKMHLIDELIKRLQSQMKMIDMNQNELDEEEIENIITTAKEMIR